MSIDWAVGLIVLAAFIAANIGYEYARYESGKQETHGKDTFDKDDER